METKSYDHNRYMYFDLLRIIACIMVITQHVLADGIYDEWESRKTIMAIYDSISKVAVPIFFMMSGALSTNTSIKKYLRKAARLFILFIIFKVLFSLWDCYYFNKDISLSILYYERRITDLNSYKYHLWYIPEFIVLLFLAPIINSASRINKNCCMYLSVIFVLYSYILPNSSTIQILHKITINPIQAILEPFPFHLTLGLGYYCIGKAIIILLSDRIDILRRHKTLFCVTTWFAYIITTAMLSFLVIKKSIEANIYDFSLLNRGNSLFVLLSSIFLFISFAEISILSSSDDQNEINHSFPKKKIPFCSHIAPYTLYIYLIHPLFVDMLTILGFKPLSFNPAFATPIKVIIVFFLSLVLSIPASSAEKHIIKLIQKILPAK